MDWLLEEVGLAERRHHRLGELSGGEQQRVAIAVALANRPRLLLADEPTGEVDTSMAQRILDLLLKINEELNLTIIIVTHDPKVAARTRRVVAIRDGRTSTEQIQTQHPSSHEEVKAAGALHESPMIVVDAAGRLQIPRPYLTQFGIGDRVRLEPLADGLVIQPIAGRAVQPTEAAEWHAAAADLYVDEDLPPERPHGRLQRMAERLASRAGSLVKPKGNPS
jgi:energy-coupling factor transporter ATP-binding protein EcfA2